MAEEPAHAVSVRHMTSAQLRSTLREAGVGFEEGAGREELEALSERMATFERSVEGKLDALMAAVRVGGS